MADISTVSTYAYNRGVELVIEIDVPGHAASWTKGIYCLHYRYRLESN